MCARFLSHLLLLCIGRVHGAISVCTDIWEVHHVSAENKSLISDTVYTYTGCIGSKEVCTRWKTMHIGPECTF